MITYLKIEIIKSIRSLNILIIIGAIIFIYLLLLLELFINVEEELKMLQVFNRDLKPAEYLQNKIIDYNSFTIIVMVASLSGFLVELELKSKFIPFLLNTLPINYFYFVLAKAIFCWLVTILLVATMNLMSWAILEMFEYNNLITATTTISEFAKLFFYQIFSILPLITLAMCLNYTVKTQFYFIIPVFMALYFLSKYVSISTPFNLFNNISLQPLSIVNLIDIFWSVFWFSFTFFISFIALKKW
jgi:hypothetical protein